MFDSPTLSGPTSHSRPLTVEGEVLVAALEGRTSAVTFDADRSIGDELIAELIRLATTAPSAFNIQNWRFIAIRSSAAKERLKEAAYGQEKVCQAGVTFVLVGREPRAGDLPERLAPAVADGSLPAPVAEAWVGMAEGLYAENPQARRDEAIRSASLAAGALMLAARAHGLASCPMTGFDPEALARITPLAEDDLPVMLMAVGHPSTEVLPPKPRRPLGELLDFV